MRFRRHVMRATIVAVALLAWRVGFLLTSPIGCGFESSDRGMATFEMPSKGRTLAMVEEAFEEYRERKGDPTLRLYRTTGRDWTNPLRWPDYLVNRKWHYPYMMPSKNPNFFRRQDLESIR